MMKSKRCSNGTQRNDMIRNKNEMEMASLMEISRGKSTEYFKCTAVMLFILASFAV